jgi:hypothetical protein
MGDVKRCKNCKWYRGAEDDEHGECMAPVPGWVYESDESPSPQVWCELCADECQCYKRGRRP